MITISDNFIVSVDRKAALYVSYNNKHISFIT